MIIRKQINKQHNCQRKRMKRNENSIENIFSTIADRFLFKLVD